MSDEIINAMFAASIIALVISLTFDVKTIRLIYKNERVSKELECKKKQLLEKKNELDYIRGCLYGAEKKAELLQDELTKLKIKK